MIAGAARLIELVGALVIAGYCVRALIEAARSRQAGAVHRIVAEGVLWGMDIKLAATLLKTIELSSWQQIAAFAAILALRTLIKRTVMQAGVRNGRT